MLQTEPLDRERDRAAKPAAPGEAARNCRRQLEGRISLLIASSQAGPVRGDATALRHAVEPRPEQYLG